MLHLSCKFIVGRLNQSLLFSQIVPDTLRCVVRCHVNDFARAECIMEYVGKCLSLANSARSAARPLTRFSCGRTAHTWRCLRRVAADPLCLMVGAFLAFRPKADCNMQGVRPPQYIDAGRQARAQPCAQPHWILNATAVSKKWTAQAVTLHSWVRPRV